MIDLQKHFEHFRKNTFGSDSSIITPYGSQKMIYADWIASGRLYKPIEKVLAENFYPLVGNTHSESSTTGTAMTRAYHYSRYFIKKHVNASEKDIIITQESGMTGVVSKFQRILGLKIPEQFRNQINLTEELTPVVFITHMEHHSNHTSWLETIADVVVVAPTPEGLVDHNSLIELLEKYKNRKLKIGSFSACSNVTGITNDYHALAKIMHQHEGLCFVDFACSAPYVDINMHPEDEDERLDAIFFSPHKFLGGPGTPGILIFNSELYHNKIPDCPGGGTVDWTNPWGEYKFVDNIEAREDGGTPPFLQTIKSALAVRLKEKMNTKLIAMREQELLKILFEEFKKINGLVILAGNIEHRLGAVSFYIEGIHFNLVVRILNDRFGIQVRGGCSCAGTYGHYLLHVDRNFSHRITEKINHGDYSEKPGWIRLSIHPTMTNDELYYIVDAIKQLVANIDTWKSDYTHNKHTNEFDCNISFNDYQVQDWFMLCDNDLPLEDLEDDYLDHDRINIFT